MKEKRFNAEQIQDEKKRLLELQKIDAEEQEIETARLQTVIDNANAGTQAKIDAEIALNEFKEESRQQNLTRDKEIADLTLSAEEQTKKTRQENLDAFEIAAATTMNALIAINELTQAFAKEDEASQKKAFEVNKAIGIANAIINTSVGVSKALATKSDSIAGISTMLTASIPVSPSLSSSNINSIISIVFYFKKLLV